VNDITGVYSGINMHERCTDEFGLAIHKWPEICSAPAVVGRQAEVNIEESTDEGGKKWPSDNGCAIAD
jgi:hypothetical protein